jgi:addiction module RelB/DinJ family antitoxin
MITKTVINIKTDKILKNKAQGLARDLGLPLATIVNAYLREFVREQRIVFSKPPYPNVKTRKILNEALADIKRGKNLAGPFNSVEEMMKSLRK